MGKRVHLGDFSPVAELRWLRSGKKMVLQQAWHAMGTDGLGYVCEGETEWRDVPVTKDDGHKKRFDNLLAKSAKPNR
jgi:hypothetical protein